MFFFVSFWGDIVRTIRLKIWFLEFILRRVNFGTKERIICQWFCWILWENASALMIKCCTYRMIWSKCMIWNKLICALSMLSMNMLTMQKLQKIWRSNIWNIWISVWCYQCHWVWAVVRMKEELNCNRPFEWLLSFSCKILKVFGSTRSAATESFLQHPHKYEKWLKIYP